MVRCARATSGNPAGYGKRAKLRWFAAVPGMRPHTVRRAATVTVFLPGEENLERTSSKSERVRKNTEAQRGPEQSGDRHRNSFFNFVVCPRLLRPPLCLCVSVFFFPR